MAIALSMAAFAQEAQSSENLDTTNPKDHSSKGMEDMVSRANYVFKGTVIKVESKKSIPNEGDLEGVPYTFVTYEVEQEIKGSTNGDTITLRFIGGPTDEDSFLLVGGQPLMDVGDRDILFVKNNGESACPLVGCEKGRFRDIDGLVFNELGQSIFISNEGEVQAGQAINLEEVNTHYMSDTIKISRHETELENDGYGIESLDDLPNNMGYRPDSAAFVVMIQDAVQRVYSTEQLAALEPARSVNPNEPFIDKIFDSNYVTQIEEPLPERLNSNNKKMEVSQRNKPQQKSVIDIPPDTQTQPIESKKEIEPAVHLGKSPVQPDKNWIVYLFSILALSISFSIAYRVNKK